MPHVCSTNELEETLGSSRISPQWGTVTSPQLSSHLVACTASHTATDPHAAHPPPVGPTRPPPGPQKTRFLHLLPHTPGDGCWRAPGTANDSTWISRVSGNIPQQAGSSRESSKARQQEAAGWCPSITASPAQGSLAWRSVPNAHQICPHKDQVSPTRLCYLFLAARRHPVLSTGITPILHHYPLR